MIEGQLRKVPYPLAHSKSWQPQAKLRLVRLPEGWEHS